jgi:hypothetical protein
MGERCLRAFGGTGCGHGTRNGARDSYSVATDVLGITAKLGQEKHLYIGGVSMAFTYHKQVQVQYPHRVDDRILIMIGRPTIDVLAPTLLVTR